MAAVDDLGLLSSSFSTSARHGSIENGPKDHKSRMQALKAQGRNSDHSSVTKHRPAQGPGSMAGPWSPLGPKALKTLNFEKGSVTKLWPVGNLGPHGEATGPHGGTMGCAFAPHGALWAPCAHGCHNSGRLFGWRQGPHGHHPIQVAPPGPGPGLKFYAKLGISTKLVPMDDLGTSVSASGTESHP